MSLPTDRTPLLADRNEHSHADRPLPKNGYTTPSTVSTGSPSPESDNGHFNLANLTRGDFVWVCVGLWSATFLSSLDGTIVATLLTDIGSSFEKSNIASFLGTSYLLSVCCFTPIYGRLCDIIGRRGSMMTALFFFGVGTVFCAFAPSMESLIAARAIAGIGGGGLTSVGSIIISDLVPLKRRGLYQGLANCCFGLGAGLGGPVGGFIADTWGWRAAFIIQIPILLASTLLVWFKVHIPLKGSSQTFREKLARIDFLGSFTLVLAVSSLLLAMTLKTSSETELAWSDPRVWGLLVVSLVVGSIFVFVEGKMVREPIMPLRLMRQRNPAFVALSNWLLSVMAFSVLYNVPLYFSAVKLTSAKVAGSHLVPNSVALACGSVAAGWYMRRTGKFYWMTAFMSCMSLLSMILLSTWGPDTPEWILWVAVAPSGFGLAGVLTSTLVALIGSVDKADIACSTGISYLFRTTGQVLGVSLSAALLQAILQKKLSAAITGPGSEEIIQRIRHSTSSIISLPPDLKASAIDAYQAGIRAVFICQVVVAFLVLLACLGMKEVELPDSGSGSTQGDSVVKVGNEEGGEDGEEVSEGHVHRA